MLDRYLKYLLVPLAGLFPLFSASVPHAGSTIYGVFFLIGLIYGWPAWKRLLDIEKLTLLGYVVFALVVSLSFINTDDWGYTTHKIERILRLLTIIPTYLLIRRLDLDLLKIFLVGSCVACLVLAGNAWYSTTHVGLEVASGAYHKIVFGDIAMLFAVIVALALFSVAHKAWHVVVGLICIGAGLYASALSLTRGAWLLLPALLPVFFVLYLRVIKRRHVLVGVAVVVLALGTGQYWLPSSLTESVRSGIDEIQQYRLDPGKNTSWGGRINMWRDSLTMFQQHPIVGVGIGDFWWERNILMQNGAAIKGPTYHHAHSIYFDALATTGILGLLALLLGLFLMPLRMLQKAWRPFRHRGWDRFALLGGFCTLVAFAVFGLSEGWLSRNPMINTYAMCLLVFMTASGRFLAAEAESAPSPSRDGQILTNP